MKKFEIRVYTKLTKNVEMRYEKLKQEAFQKDYPKLDSEEEKDHKDRFSSKDNITKYLLAFENTDLIGGMHILKRRIVINGKKVLLGGIGGVWTRTDKRKVGIATMVLKKGMSILKKQMCDIVYICTDIKKLAHMYEKVGFKKLTMPQTYLGKSGKRYFDNDGMIAPGVSRKLFLEILHSNKPFDIGKGNW